MPIKVSSKLHSLMQDRSMTFLGDEYKIENIGGVIFASKNGRAVHSKYNIEKESISVLSQIENESRKNVYLFYGFGLGYHLSYFVEHESLYIKNKDISIIVVVTDLPLFVYAYYNLQMNSIAKYNTVFVWHEENTQEIAKNLSAENVFGVNFIMLPSLSKEEKENAALLSKDFLSEVERMFSDFFTRLNFENTWTRNILINIAKLEGVDISSFQNALDGFSALIIAAGPSLNKNTDKIKSLMNDFFIIAVDTSYSALVKNGITPDIIVTSDAGIYNAYDFVYETGKYPYLALDICVSKNALDINLDRTRIISFTSAESEITEYIKNKIGIKITKLNSSNSVATTAVDLANYLGIKNAILIGYDNSYPDYERHAKHAMSYEYSLMRTNKLCTLESAYFNAIYKRSDMSLYPPRDYVFSNLLEYFSSLNRRYENMDIMRIKENAVSIDTLDRDIDLKDYAACGIKEHALKLLDMNYKKEKTDKDKMKNMYEDVRNALALLMEKMNENYNSIVENKNNDNEAERIYEDSINLIKETEEKIPFLKNILLYMRTILKRRNINMFEKALFLTSETIKNAVYFHTRVCNVLESLCQKDLK